MIDSYVVGDNINIINSIINDSIDLVYIDPPFNTNRDFGDFNDKWKTTEDFCSGFMEPRLEVISKKLKSTGSLVLHCDIKASHYLKVLLDKIFGANKFRNEIIWVTGGHAKTSKKLYKTHDSLLVYSKSTKSKFNPIYKPYDEAYYKKNNVKFCNKHKKNYVSCAIYNAQPEITPRPNLRYEWNGHFKQWLISKTKMQFLHDDNRLQYNSKGVPRIKRFLDEMQGVPIQDVWMDINSIQSNEKLDYATQKPIKLLERIITLYTDLNDVVLDCFAGSAGHNHCLRSRFFSVFPATIAGFPGWGCFYSLYYYCCP